MISSVREHYESLLAEHYEWMFGVSFDAKVAEQRQLLLDAGVAPLADGRADGHAGGLAVDLGCGSGFQSFALSGLGYAVDAIDLSPELLRVLADRIGSRRITARPGDLRELSSMVGQDSADVVVCMGDTLTHLPLRDDVSNLFRAVARVLKRGGRFVCTYRDLAGHALTGLDRFIPVHSDDHRIMTCFLEYEGPTTVIVNDLVHTRGADGTWSLRKSAYRKLRLASDWIREALMAAGLSVRFERTGRLVEFAATRD